MICVICSAGGHLSEALAALEKVEGERYFVTFGEEHAKARLADQEAYFVLDPHTSLFKYLVNAVQSTWLFLRKRPKVIFTTGAGIALATCLLGKIFGSRLIYLESGARITTLSRTGKLLYGRVDAFIVQWKPLQEQYPESIYVGSLM